VPARLGTTTRARAPLRLGLAGGGTDLSPYCDEFGGAALNVTIDRFAYAFISPRKDGQVMFRASDLNRRETVQARKRLPDATLLLHRGVYERVVRDYNDSMAIAATVTTTVDAPPNSGLGASSALVVALISAYHTFLGIPLDPYEIAHLAVDIERNDLGLPGGLQDQYAAAFGGTNFIEFRGDHRVIVNPLRISDSIRNELEASLVVCFTGGARDAATIIMQQTAYMAEHRKTALAALDRLKANAFAMKDEYLLGDIREVAHLLGDSWEAKKLTASNISTDRIDRLCNVAFSCGALAGKVSGAGGGGFVVFIVPPEDRSEVIKALDAAGGKASPVKFTDRGCETWQMRL
jgi:D-glycero-alpha-D-manno-heptose-7-phosphate kinase